jgi:DNA-directed RNA polymerase specialized sigma24 family protein
VERYLPVVRAYLHARWKERVSETELEDAVQEVFVECLKHEGVLEKNRSRRGAGFRAYRFGAVRNVALRAEETRARKVDAPRTDSFEADGVAAGDDTSSRAFDRAWAAAIVREAAEKQRERATSEASPRSGASSSCASCSGGARHRGHRARLGRLPGIAPPRIRQGARRVRGALRGSSPST